MAARARKTPIAVPWTAVATASMGLAVAAFFLPWVQLLPGKASKPSRGARQPAADWRPKDTPRDSKPVWNPQMREYMKELKTGVKSVEHSARNRFRFSGFEIPHVANGESSRAAVQLAGMFQRDAKSKAQLKEAGPKSYAVYLLPLLQVLLGLALLRWGTRRVVAGAISAVCLAVPPLGYWQITQAMSQSQGLARIDYGLWLALLAYWGLTAAAVIRYTPR